MSYGWRDFGTGHLDELCDECGFDSRRANVDVDIPASIAMLRSLVDDPRATERPTPETWSTDEYTAHCLELLGESISVIDTGKPEPRCAIADLADGLVKARSLLDSVAGTDLHRPIDVGGDFPATPAWMLHHLLHDLEHHALDIRRGYAKLELQRLNGRTVERDARSSR
ncbi:hypothetical protein [Flexivirga sp. B27]